MSLLDFPTPPAWTESALCAQVGDPDLFFPEKGGNVRDAKQVCAGCPVRAECLTHAIDTREPDGIWGGLAPRERRALHRKEAS